MPLTWQRNKISRVNLLLYWLLGYTLVSNSYSANYNYVNLLIYISIMIAHQNLPY